jgi:Na+-transporting NADH:ubiquinone oxidoreductase subunit B
MADGKSGGDAEKKQKPKKPFLKRFFRVQKPMVTMTWTLLPVVAFAIFLFGWRVLAVVLACLLVGVFTEWLFTRSRDEPVSSAVWVTCLLFALSLPPGVPWLTVVVGIVVAVMFGKEVFGGFGRNVFNPALVGRAFVYIAFPAGMTRSWPVPELSLPGGFARWGWAFEQAEVDAMTAATPLKAFKNLGEPADYLDMFLGRTGGSMGETCALLILLCGAWLCYKRAANWRIPVGVLLGAAAMSFIFRVFGATNQVADPLYQILGGGMMFGAFFMATDPVSAPMRNGSRWIFGVGVGVLAVIIRGFGAWYCGVMFAIIFMNMFNPITDHYMASLAKWRKARAQAREEEGEGAQ